MNDLTKLLTPRVAIELCGAEGLALEWYLDTSGVGTWSMGVTDASGHDVDRYKDHPSTIEKALEVAAWLIRARYAPAVLAAFQTVKLTEAQFAAALSFHYNTGAIGRAAWVKSVVTGYPATAKSLLRNNYTNGDVLKGRRAAEAALFFDGQWAHEDGIVPIYPVLKPSYRPDFAHPKRVDIRADMMKALAA
jgi:GH24 family phage-related lysozyme (muramidase)